MFLHVNIRTLKKLYIAFHLFFLNKVVYHYWLFSVHSVFMSFIYIYSLNCESTKLYIEMTQTRMHEQIFTEEQLDNVICFCFFKENSFIFFLTNSDNLSFCMWMHKMPYIPYTSIEKKTWVGQVLYMSQIKALSILNTNSTNTWIQVYATLVCTIHWLKLQSRLAFNEYISKT